MRRKAIPTDSIQDYRSRRDFKSDWLFVALLGLLLVSFAIYVGIGIKVPQKANLAPILSISVFLVLALPIAIWNKPQLGIYLIVLCACMFVQSPQEGEFDPLTGIPVFWNISTIGQHYMGTSALNAIQFNMGEIIIILTLGFWLIHKIATQRLRFRVGVFFPWLTAYMAFAIFGGVNGLATGGDLTFILWELRAQVYFYIAYLMATNILEDQEDIQRVFWTMAIGIGIKSLIGTTNYIQHPNVSADEGVLRHEDSLLMNMLILGALLFRLGKLPKNLVKTITFFVVPAAVTVLANGRRASIAALFLAIPLTMSMCAVMIKEQRQRLIKTMLTLVVLGALYLPVAWNGKGVWALPARAIRSQFTPDDRDASSDYYRLAENSNLKYTRDINPLTGYGYGKPYITIWEQYGRTDVFAKILPHNGVLWIWMRLGHPGFILFWMFASSVLVWGPHMLRSLRAPQLQVIGTYSVGALLMLIMYGKYDLAFANYRSMILTGILLGVCAALPRIDDQQEADRIAKEEAEWKPPQPIRPANEEGENPYTVEEEWRLRTNW